MSKAQIVFSVMGLFAGLLVHSGPARATEPLAPISIESLNQSTGYTSIVVTALDVLVAPYVLNTLTVEQHACVRESLKNVEQAATNVYGSMSAFEASLQKYRFIYRLKLFDSTSAESRRVYGTGRKYSRTFLTVEDTGTIFSQLVLENFISVYIDPDTGAVACASSDTVRVEKFLREYEAYLDRVYPDSRK